MIKLNNTEIDLCKIGHHKVFIKREDTACAPPGPPFAKVRGLYPMLKKLSRENVNDVGYMETTISMASWGVSYFAKDLGMKAVIFNPTYKDGKPKHEQSKHIEIWKSFGAEIWPIQATRLSINWHIANKMLKEKYKNGYMLPQGLPFEETIEDVANQVIADANKIRGIKTIVMCIGSGTMAAGVMRGLSLIKMEADVYGVFVSQTNIGKMRKKIEAASRVANFNFQKGGLLRTSSPNLHLIDNGYKYTDKIETETPFPCNSYYDKKAWQWMLENINSLKKPILFWNIGAEAK